MVKLENLKSYYFSNKLTEIADHRPEECGEDTFWDFLKTVPKYWFISTKLCAVFFAHIPERKWNDTVDAWIEYLEYRKELKEYEGAL